MNLNRVFQALNDSGFAGGLAGGAVSSALMSKSGRKAAGKALKIGGIAAIGGLAYKAYQSHQLNNKSHQRASESHQLSNENLQHLDDDHGRHQNPGDQAGTASKHRQRQWESLVSENFEIEVSNEQSTGMLLIQAMITAAYADGQLSHEERSRIFRQLESYELDAEEKAVIFDAFAKPLTLEKLCNKIHQPALALEAYTVSSLAMDSDSAASKHYLDALAAKLRIPQPLRESVDIELAS